MGARTDSATSEFISQKVFIESLFKSKFPHKSVNLFFILVIRKDKFTGACENSILLKFFINTFCEIRVERTGCFAIVNPDLRFERASIREF
jgi:hypothetical protein